MARVGRSLIALIALGITFWLIWSRLRIVIFVPLPWWGLLLVGLLIFLALDFLLARIFARRP
ncbi:MAG: hypothetical protein AB4911_05740 [Oscillochloridaceae bacterium umkhey_bin13]